MVHVLNRQRPHTGDQLPPSLAIIRALFLLWFGWMLSEWLDWDFELFQVLLIMILVLQKVASLSFKQVMMLFCSACSIAAMAKMNRYHDDTTMLSSTSTEATAQPPKNLKATTPNAAQNSPPTSYKPAYEKLKFLNYTPSTWEQIWLDQIKSIEHDRSLMCQLISKQSKWVKDFTLSTCNYFSKESGWCKIEDTYETFWMNLTTFEIIYGKNRLPEGWRGVRWGNEQVYDYTNPDILSRFYFQNETTGEIIVDYIEPLVSHLRHPISCCEHMYTYGSNIMGGSTQQQCGRMNGFYTSRGQYLAPSTKRIHEKARKFYFDAGASHWSKGKGGPSLPFFTRVWKRQGIVWDHIYAFEGRTTKDAFDATVPKEWSEQVHYQQTWVRSKPDDTSMSGPFLPDFIKNLTHKEDYVLFKLDIDSPGVEEGNIEYLLDEKNDILEYIDEFLYEFHLEEGQKMSKWYDVFLALRKRGVRAHSWI